MTDWSALELDGLDADDLRRIQVELTRRFCPPLRAELVQQCVLESATHFQQAAVRTYLPILVERRAGARLRELVERHGDAVEHGARAPDEVPRGYVGPSVRAS
jgi:hypothetical protein